MTNAQARSYAVLAIKNLLEYEIIRGDKKEACSAIDVEMKTLFDEWEEEVAEKKANCILQGN
jgi:hypothetical protein